MDIAEDIAIIPIAKVVVVPDDGVGKGEEVAERDIADEEASADVAVAVMPDEWEYEDEDSEQGKNGKNHCLGYYRCWVSRRNIGDVGRQASLKDGDHGDNTRGEQSERARLLRASNLCRSNRSPASYALN